METERMLHRGQVKQVKPVTSKRLKRLSSKYSQKVEGVLSILLQAEWFRTTDSLIYTRVAETYDEKLESSFDNITIEIVVPYIDQVSNDRWTVLFPNSTLELSGAAPTELTIEHDNEELKFKWSKKSKDYIRSASPEVGGRILFFPPGEVLLVSMVEQPFSKGLRVDTARERPQRPFAAQKEEIKPVIGSDVVLVGGQKPSSM